MGRKIWKKHIIRCIRKNPYCAVSQIKYGHIKLSARCRQLKFFSACQQNNGSMDETYKSDFQNQTTVWRKIMITVTGIRNVNYAAYDEVWAIVRSLKNPGKMKHAPEMSPSWALFKKYLQLRDTGKWNTDAFRSIYVPAFLKEMSGIEPKKSSLNLPNWTGRERESVWYAFVMKKLCVTGALLRESCNTQASMYRV